MEELRIDPTIAYDVVELPSKGIYYSTQKKSLRIAYLTAADENILASPNLIQTNSGEKLCFPTFGTNIRAILSKTNIENPQDLIMEEIQRVVSIYMPFVSLTTFSSEIDKYESQKGNPVITLNIGFSVPNLSNEQRLITIKLGMTY